MYSGPECALELTLDGTVERIPLLNQLPGSYVGESGYRESSPYKTRREIVDVWRKKIPSQG